MLQLRSSVGPNARVATARSGTPTKPTATAPAPTAMAPVFQTVPAQSPPPVAEPVPAPAVQAQVAQPVVAGSPPPAQVPTPTAGSPAANLPTVVPVAGKPVTATPAAAVVTITPGKTRRAAGIEWRWPADGPLLARFNAGDANPGIDIAGNSGDPVRAAADGVVVYSGNGLVGYGELVIIKHNDNYLSAYGHNRKRLVKEGERVRAGQTIAEMGSSGASRNELQFQVRLNGKPMDPLDYLPSR
jgi:lipoprotein NlpD